MRKSTQSAGGGQPILDGMPEPARVHPVTAALKRTPLVRALEAELVAGPIIADFHHDRWYKQPRIIYLFSEKIPKAGGRDAYATVRKVGGMNAFLYHLLELEASKGSPLVHSDLGKTPDAFNHEQWDDVFLMDPEKYDLPNDRYVFKGEPLFIITIHWGSWQIVFNEEQRRALIDHELEHIKVECGDKDIQYSLRGHDLEEFTSIVKRHGCWAADITRFKEVVLET